MIDKMKKEREIISKINDNLTRIKRTLKIDREEKEELESVPMREPECMDDEMDYMIYNLENILKLSDEIENILVGGAR